MISVLIVDDNEVFRQDTREHFEAAGWKVDVAADGREAIEFLSRRGLELDAVVLDRVMPGVGGEEVIRWMRSQPSLTETCIVMFTSVFANAIDSAIEAFNLGAFHYLEGPPDLSELERVLRAGIALHRAHKMRRELLRTLDGERVKSKIVHVIRESLHSDHVHLLFIQLDGRLLRETESGVRAADDSHRRFATRIAAGAVGVFEENREQVALLDPICVDAGSLMAVPIIASRDQLHGILEVESSSERAFSQTWMNVLRYLADLIGMGLEIGKEAERLRAVYRDFRHHIATHVQIMTMQARRMQQLIATTPLAPAESMHSYVRFIVDNAATIEGNVQDIKAIAVDPPSPRLEMIDVVELVHSSLCEQRPKFEDLKISAHVEPRHGPILVNTDRDSLSYSMRCLINNAAESIQDNRQQYRIKDDLPNDRIAVSVKDAGAYIEIKIDDTGIGFDNEIADKLFLPLFSTKAKRLPSGQSQESTGIDRVERLLELTGLWCRQDPRSNPVIDEHNKYRALGRGMELFIHDKDTIDMYIGHRDVLGGLDLHNLEGSSICHVEIDPLAAEWFGRGEGLFSVRKYVARLGGTVLATSPGIGRGATFTITLPKSA